MAKKSNKQIARFILHPSRMNKIKKFLEEDIVNLSLPTNYDPSMSEAVCDWIDPYEMFLTEYTNGKVRREKYRSRPVVISQAQHASLRKLLLYCINQIVTGAVSDDDAIAP